MRFFENIFFRNTSSSGKIHILGKDYEINPQALLYSQAGLDKYEKKDYPGAIIEFSKAINVQPDNQNFYLMRGNVYEDKGDDEQAEKDFSKHLELEPSSFVGAYRMGMVCFRRKDFDNAIKWLKKAFDQAPELDFDQIGLGNNNIIFVHKKIIAGNLGNFLVQIKKIEEGIKYLDEAIRLDPNYHNPYMVKGMAYAQLGRFNEAISLLEKASQLGNQQAELAIWTVKQSIQQSNKADHQKIELNFVFHSSDHLRYENGIHVSGPHGGASRAVKVEPNINGGTGYTVTLFNTDGEHAVIQMAPKQMKILEFNNQQVKLRGFGVDAFGISFEDYGLTIFHENGGIIKCILHMYDRTIDIEYLA